MSDESVVSGIISASALQQYVDVFTPIVDEGRVHFGDDGIYTSVVDPANIGMQEAELSLDAFEAYDSPGSATIGVSFNRLDEVLDVADSGALVHFGINMETRKLELRFDGVEQDVAMIDPDAIRAEQDKSEIDLPNMVAIGADQLDRAIDVAELNSDHIEIEGTEDGGVSFNADGDVDSGRVRYDAEDLSFAEVSDPGASLFSLEYVTELFDPVPKGGEVEIWFGDEFPMRWYWENDAGTLEVESMLAPRIQSR